MTENLPKDGVQSRQAVAQRCCPNICLCVVHCSIVCAYEVYLIDPALTRDSRHPVSAANLVGIDDIVVPVDEEVLFFGNFPFQSRFVSVKINCVTIVGDKEVGWDRRIAVFRFEILCELAGVGFGADGDLCTILKAPSNVITSL